MFAEVGPRPFHDGSSCRRNKYGGTAICRTKTRNAGRRDTDVFYVVWTVHPRTQSNAALAMYGPDMDVGWVHPWVGLGWVGLNFDGHIMGWVGINGLNCNDSTHVHIVAIVNKSVTA